MRIAVTYENGQIFQHFGHSAQFKFYMIENGMVASSVVLSTGGTGHIGHGALADFLVKHQADALICGGIGGGAQAALKQAGIALYAGVKGGADAAVEELLAGKLIFQAGATCSHHHDHDHHHGEGHSCHDHHEG